MARLTQGVPAQVFTPHRQLVVSLTADTPSTVVVPPGGMVRYSADAAVMMTLGDTFDAAACFKAQDNVFGVPNGVEAITFQVGEATDVYVEVG